MYKKIISEINKLGTPEKAQIYQRFFKTGKGEYGEGDVFVGATMPELRAVAKRFTDATLADIQELLNSKIPQSLSCSRNWLHRGLGWDMFNYFETKFTNECVMGKLPW